MKTPVKTTKVNKKRRGKDNFLAPAHRLRHLLAAHCQIEKSRSISRSDLVSYTDGSAASRCSSSRCSTTANVIGEEGTDTPRRPITTACTYDTYSYQTIERHSGIAVVDSSLSNIISRDRIDIDKSEI